MAVTGLYRHPNQGVVNADVPRLPGEIVARFRDLYTGFILDHLGKIGVIGGVLPLKAGTVICGPAVTSLGPDLSVRRMAIDLALPGDVLVVAAGGRTDTACFGDGTAQRMALKGMEGVVIDGCTRDARFLREMNFPVFCKGVTPRNFHYPEEGLHGAVNVPVVCGGTLINPGDLIFGDDDGVIVIPRAVAEDRLAEMEENLRLEREERAERAEFHEFGVKATLVERGYAFQ